VGIELAGDGEGQVFEVAVIGVEAISRPPGRRAVKASAAQKRGA
jgi:hypothetical protein